MQSEVSIQAVYSATLLGVNGCRSPLVWQQGELHQLTNAPRARNYMSRGLSDVPSKHPVTYLLEYWITIMTKQPANESLHTWHQLVTASDTYITCRTYYKVSNNWACIETDNCYKFQFNQLSDKGWKATTSHRGQQRQVRFTFTATQATVARFLLRSLY